MVLFENEPENIHHMQLRNWAHLYVLGLALCGLQVTGNNSVAESSAPSGAAFDSWRWEVEDSNPTVLSPPSAFLSKDSMTSSTQRIAYNKNIIPERELRWHL